MTRDPRPAEGDDAAARIVKVLPLAAPIAVLLLAVGVGLTRGVPLAVLVLASGALAAVIALFWQSVRTLVGETQLTGADAFALGTPHAEEERKRAVLRALKDLEFERSVGKISEDDYRELVTHYRGEAKRLLRQIDDAAQPRRDRVARLVEERLRAAGLAPGDAATTARDATAREPVAPAAVEVDATRPDATAAAGGDGEAADTRPTCERCGTANDADATFCKKCGKPLTRGDEPGEAAAADDEAIER